MSPAGNNCGAKSAEALKNLLNLLSPCGDTQTPALTAEQA
jgi:hypothetical protein